MQRHELPCPCGPAPGPVAMGTRSSPDPHVAGDSDAKTLTGIARTRPANPSRLGTFLACPLRYLLETERSGMDRVGDHPAAFFGTAVHQAAELLRRQDHAEPSDCVEVLEKCLARLLSNSRRTGQLISWMLARYGKNGLLSRAQFLSQAGFAKSLAERFPAARGSAPVRMGTQAGLIPVGRERRLASAVLDVAGRADAIYWAGSRHLRIVDFKTGSIRDSDGNPNRSYLMQVAAYGVIAKQLDPKVSISLELLGISDSWAGSLDAALIRAVAQLLDDFRNALPLGVAVSPASIARSGEHCSQCSYRPSCQLYSEHVEERMAVDHMSRGFDLVGDLLDLKWEGDFAAMRLRLANGRTVRISRIPGLLLQDITGARLAVYGLRALEVCKAGSTPQNFSVIDIQRPRNSAFQSFFRLA